MGEPTLDAALDELEWRLRRELDRSWRLRDELRGLRGTDRWLARWKHEQVVDPHITKQR